MIHEQQRLDPRPKPRQDKRSAGILIGILLVISALILGAWKIWSPLQANAEKAQAAPAYQTQPIRVGNLALTANGSGTVVTGNSIDLGFSAAGKVAEIDVHVGDAVKQGQTLAKLTNIDALQQIVDQKQLDFITAQQNLNNLMTNGAVNLAQAATDQSSAQAAYAQAQNSVLDPHDPRCAPSLTEKYYDQYISYVIQASPWEKALQDSKTGYSYNYIMQNLTPLRRLRDLAYDNYTWCQSYNSLEIQASQANLQVTQAKMQQSEANLQTLKANNGINPSDLAIAQATLKNAELQLASAKTNLAGATITAPMDGTVTAVNGVVGQNQTGGKFITVADLNHPQIQVNIDETDLTSFTTSCPAQVTFDSIPNKTFNGTVVQVYPTLANSNNVTSAQGLIQLNSDAANQGTPLPINLNAQVTVTCKQVTNALLAPIQAVHESTGQPAYVYILNAQGEPQKRVVEVGIKSPTFVEIKSGLSAGQEVITSAVNQ